MTPLEDALARAVDNAIAESLGPAVQDALAAVLPDIIRRASIPTLLTTAELADLTGWSTRHIEYLRARRRLPFVKIGRSIRFKTADVESLLDDGRVEARAKALAAKVGG